MKFLVNQADYDAHKDDFPEGTLIVYEVIDE
ncbi:hypothetical protein SEA_WALTZ_35 [Arthrobacter phage Waltz]|nr:hypothetical protein SEA_WALTZ_35 [Arthrobacter phage Waltz]